MGLFSEGKVSLIISSPADIYSFYSGHNGFMSEKTVINVPDLSDQGATDAYQNLKARRLIASSLSLSPIPALSTAILSTSIDRS
jgi:hypothetical protein